MLVAWAWVRMDLALPPPCAEPIQVEENKQRKYGRYTANPTCYPCHIRRGPWQWPPKFR